MTGIPPIVPRWGFGVRLVASQGFARASPWALTSRTFGAQSPRGSPIMLARFIADYGMLTVAYASGSCKKRAYFALPESLSSICTLARFDLISILSKPDSGTDLVNQSFTSDSIFCPLTSATTLPASQVHS
jgi:hypothetical protein